MSAVLGDDAQDVCSLLLVGGSDHSESKSGKNARQSCQLV